MIDKLARPNQPPGRLPASARGCARRDSNPYVRGHWNLNPARLPVTPLARVLSLASRQKDLQTSTPSWARRRATWPVARTLRSACVITPAGLTTKVERINPWKTLP